VQKIGFMCGLGIEKLGFILKTKAEMFGAVR
jgi:hypothetical protein